MRAGEGVARGHMTCYVDVFIRLGGLHDLRDQTLYSSTQYMLHNTVVYSPTVLLLYKYIGT